MAELTCTIKEFHKFIGPKIRNSIQYLTKKRKKELGYICQRCRKRSELEAAHKGKSRKQIIEEVLNKYIIDENNLVVKIDLDKVYREILSAHRPIDDYFEFLCPECHRKQESSAR